MWKREKTGDKIRNIIMVTVEKLPFVNIQRLHLIVIQFETPNADTIEAIEEVQRLKGNPNKKSYHSFNEILRELDDE